MIEGFKFREAQTCAMSLARLGNKYLADEEPWKKIKTDEERVKTILSISMDLCKELAELLTSFLPETSEKLSAILGDRLILNKAQLLFQKVEDVDILKQIEKLENNKKEQKVEVIENAQKEPITFEDFTKLDIRVATILEAEKVPKADKLLKLLVDTGIDQRTVVSGIAEHYSAEDVVGKKVSLLMNLAPRKIRGVESHGMILMAENQDGVLSFVSPEKGVNSGSEVR